MPAQRTTRRQAGESSADASSSPTRVSIDTFAVEVYAMVRDIPEGRVASYAQIARLTGHPKHARMVGQALKQLPPAMHTDVPWWRVVNSKGTISPRGSIDALARQADLLEREGVFVRNAVQAGDVAVGPDEGGRVSLADYEWRPDQEAAARDEP